MLNWLNLCSVFGGHWSALKINLFQGHCVGLSTSTALPASLFLPLLISSYSAALPHMASNTHNTKTACHSKCTSADSYFIVEFKMWRVILLLSMSSFRTPLHSGAFKTASSHPAYTSTVWGCFWHIEYQTAIQVEPDRIFSLTAELREEPCKEEELQHLPSMWPLWKTEIKPSEIWAQVSSFQGWFISG